MHIHPTVTELIPTLLGGVETAILGDGKTSWKLFQRLLLKFPVPQKDG